MGDSNTQTPNWNSPICPSPLLSLPHPLSATLSWSLGANLSVHQVHALINLVPPYKSLTESHTHTHTHIRRHCQLCVFHVLTLMGSYFWCPSVSGGANRGNECVNVPQVQTNWKLCVNLQLAYSHMETGCKNKF